MAADGSNDAPAKVRRSQRSRAGGRDAATRAASEADASASPTKSSGRRRRRDGADHSDGGTGKGGSNRGKGSERARKWKRGAGDADPDGEGDDDDDEADGGADEGRGGEHAVEVTIRGWSRGDGYEGDGGGKVVEVSPLGPAGGGGDEAAGGRLAPLVGHVPALRWSREEQTILEAGLATLVALPSSLQRYLSISEHLPGKSARDVALRAHWTLRRQSAAAAAQGAVGLADPAALQALGGVAGSALGAFGGVAGSALGAFGAPNGAPASLLGALGSLPGLFGGNGFPGLPGLLGGFPFPPGAFGFPSAGTASLGGFPSPGVVGAAAGQAGVPAFPFGGGTLPFLHPGLFPFGNPLLLGQLGGLGGLATGFPGSVPAGYPAALLSVAAPQGAHPPPAIGSTPSSAPSPVPDGSAGAPGVAGSTARADEGSSGAGSADAAVSPYPNPPHRDGAPSPFPAAPRGDAPASPFDAPPHGDPAAIPYPPGPHDDAGASPYPATPPVDGAPAAYSERPDEVPGYPYPDGYSHTGFSEAYGVGDGSHADETLVDLGSILQGIPGLEGTFGPSLVQDSPNVPGTGAHDAATAAGLPDCEGGRV